MAACTYKLYCFLFLHFYAGKKLAVVFYAIDYPISGRIKPAQYYPPEKNKMGQSVIMIDVSLLLPTHS